MAEEEENNSINPVEFFSFGHSNPIPNFVEKRNKEWIMFGDDNLYPEYLKELVTKSTFHSAIIKSKADMVGAQGVENDDLDEKPKLKEFIQNRFNREDLEEIIIKIAQDLIVYGAFALNVIWSKDGSQISEINYVNVDKVRIGKEDEESNDDLYQYYVSSDWKNARKEKYKPEVFQEYSEEHKSEKSQILYVKEPSPFNSDFYALPTYISAINWIEMENKISSFLNSYIDNGMFAGMHVDIPMGSANISAEQQEEFIKKMKKQFEDQENAGRTLFTFSDGETRPQFDQIELQFPDKFFENTMNNITHTILSSHRIKNPKMLGLRVPGELGSSQGSLRDDIHQFYIDVIRPKEKLIEKSLNKLGSVNGVEEDIALKKYDIFEERDKNKQQEIEEEREEGQENNDEENKVE